MKESAEKEASGRKRKAGGFTQKEKEAMAALAMAAGIGGWNVEYEALPYGACRRGLATPAGARRDGGFEKPTDKAACLRIVADAAPAAAAKADSVYGPSGWTALKAELDLALQEHAAGWAAAREPSAKGGWMRAEEEAGLDWEKWKIKRNFAELHLHSGDFLRERRRPRKAPPEEALRAIRTEAMALKAAQADGRSLEFIDPALRTPKVCAAALSSCIEAAAFVPPQSRSAIERMFAASARSNPGSLRFMPMEFRTPAVCAQAVLSGGSAVVEHVPAGEWEAAAALAAMDSVLGLARDDRIAACRRLHLRLEHALEACPHWRRQLQEQTMQIVAEEGAVLAAVPLALQTDAMRLEAVEGDAEAFGAVPDAFKSEALCLAAVRNGVHLREVPEGMRTEEVCMAAIRRRPEALALAPESFQTEARCTACIARVSLKDRQALSIVAPSRRTPAVCIAALERDPGSWRLVPSEAAADEKLWIGAVSRLGFGLESVPEQMATPAVCLAAVKADPSALSAVPEDRLTEKLCLAAVKKDGLALELVPERLRTKAVCAAAEKQNPQASAFFPASAPAEPEDGEGAGPRP